MNEFNEAALSRTERISIFLKKKKGTFIIIAAVLLLALVVVGFADFNMGKTKEASILAAEDIQDALSEYLDAEEEGKEELKKELVALIDNAKDAYKGLYAHMTALAAEAQLYAEQEMWTDAAASYSSLAEAFPKNYFAAISLLNASSMLEEAGDILAAMEVLNRIMADYSEISPDIPEVLFNLGRLSETRGNSSEALEFYEKIVNDYGSSSWTNLAKSRIIAMDS